MGFIYINRDYSLIWLNVIPIIIATIILNVSYLSSITEGKYSDGSKKKVVIVGEMSDLFANESSRSDPEFIQDYEDYTDDLNHNRIRRGNHASEPNMMPQTYVRRKTPGSVFVPVAAYSITKSKTKPYRSSNGYRKRQGTPIRRNPDMGSKQTESAVYGYMQRPEIIEFRGQYFYGPNNRPGDPLDASGSHVTGVSHGPPWEGGHSVAPAASHSYPSYSSGNKIKTAGGLGPGGLLLATLPLILAPMLSYLFTPMIIPITATVAAGRRKRDTFDDSLKVVVEYLRKVHFDEKATTRAIANYLQCDGMLADEDHCIERLSCEFSDPNNREAPELDRAVTSIILGHILANEYITDSFKMKLKVAAVYGKDNPGMCKKFNCLKVQNSQN